MLHSRSVRPTRELLNADELSLLVDYAEDMVRVRDHVMVLLSHGYDLAGSSAWGKKEDP